MASWNNSNINYQKGAILLLDGDTVQAAVSAHYSTNSLITAPTEIKIPFVRFLLQKFHQSLESQASVLSAFFPLYPSPKAQPSTKTLTFTSSDIPTSTLHSPFLYFPFITILAVKKNRRCHLSSDKNCLPHSPRLGIRISLKIGASKPF